MKICSGLYGNCMPEQTMDHYSTWAECSRQGTINTMYTIDLLGDSRDLIKSEIDFAFSLPYLFRILVIS